MHLKSKHYLLFFIIVVLSFSYLYTFEKQINHLRDKIITQNDKNCFPVKNDFISLSSLNAISTAKVTCYLHLKTVQVQIDIDLVGVSLSETPVLKTNALTTEKISVKGDIRNVEVVEDETNALTPVLFVLDNGTIIQFELTSAIPVGVSRNVKITFLQDTMELNPDYLCQFGFNWLRTIGSHTVTILCDTELSLLSCVPSPHTISTTGDKLALTWLEVNPYSFTTNVTYTRKIIIDELIIAPNIWDIGKIKASNQQLEKTFEIINNENTQLGGTIFTSIWISVNISEWSLSVGEKMFVKVTIDISRARNLACNVSFQCSFASFPINIEIKGEVTERISLANIVLITLSVLFVTAAIPTTMILVRKRKESIISNKTTLGENEEEIPIEDKINMEKWKEILTEKEFIIFNLITQNDGLTQASLVRSTTLSKSTVSRAVGRLVAKGLVKKTQYGMSNIISLNKEFFSNI